MILHLYTNTMANAQPLIACVAIVSRASQLLYFKSFGGEEKTKLQLIVFSALDAISEKVPSSRVIGAAASSASAAAAPADKFLGLIFPVEEHKVFAFVTNSNAKIILVVRDVLLREGEMRELFRGIHRLLVDATCSPFASFDAKITSPAFEEGIYRLVEASSSVIEYRGPMPF